MRVAELCDGRLEMIKYFFMSSRTFIYGGRFMVDIGTRIHKNVATKLFTELTLQAVETKVVCSKNMVTTF